MRGLLSISNGAIDVLMCVFGYFSFSLNFLLCFFLIFACLVYIFVGVVLLPNAVRAEVVMER